MGFTGYRGVTMRRWSARSIERRGRIAVAIDRPGMALSVCCGPDCVLTQRLLGSAVALPLGWLRDESTEALPLTVAIGTAAVSLEPSYWRRHRRKRCPGPFATANLANLRLCRQRALREAKGPAA